MIESEVRVGFRNEQEDELWDRWRRGESSRLIGRALRASPSSVRALLATHGGVRPLERRRSRRHLSVQEREEREEVTRGIAAAVSALAMQCALVGHHRRSHERSPAIADGAATGRRPPTWRDGNVRGGGQRSTARASVPSPRR